MTGAMSARELAARLGHGVPWLHRNRHKLERKEGMPAPLSRVGRPRWDRASIEAWLGRHHPARPTRAANDLLPPAPKPAPDASVEVWRAWLREEYGVP